MEHTFLVVYIHAIETPNYSNPLTLILTFTHNPHVTKVDSHSSGEWRSRMSDEVDNLGLVLV